VGNKSVMNQYLNDMLSQSLYHSGRKFRDDHHHPFITDVITAGNQGRPTFHREWLSTAEEWVQGCKRISQTQVAKRILAFASSREREEELARAAKGRGRRSSSCANDYEGLTGRTRATSNAGELDGTPKQDTPTKGILDSIINKTANMDLSTSESAQDNSQWLGKEIRGVRKKLNQISKLHESEAKSIVLTTAEQAKVDRRPVLEAELHVYETALEEVEKRIRELVLQDQQKHPNTFNPLAEMDVHCSKDSETTLETMVEQGEESFDMVYACEICAIKCPDKTSFELHQNGRKHRNRLSQVAEDEKQKAAESIMAQKQLEQVKATTATPPSVKTTKKKANAWGNNSAPQPKFKLPPPPHPVVAQVATTRNKASGKSFSVSTSKTPPTLPSPTAGFQGILRGQQGAKKKNSPLPNSPHSKTPPPTWATPSAVVSPVSNSRAPFHLHTASDSATSSTTPRSGQRNSYSLADFLAPKPQTTPTPTKIATSSAWGSVPAKPAKMVTRTAAVATTKKSKSLAEIQAEEAAFKSRQDRLYIVDDSGESSWFIERRERADSLHAIQESAEQERERQRMVEEQLAIEAQIKKEVAAQKEQQKKGTPNGKKHKKKNSPNKTTNTLARKKNLPQPKLGDLQNSAPKSGHEKTKRPATKSRQPKKKSEGLEKISSAESSTGSAS
jgi:ribonuclease HII